MEMNDLVVNLDAVFPLHMVDDGFIFTKNGDVTLGWELSLPRAFCVDSQGYDTMLQTLASAIRTLPDWTVVHRQDLYFEKDYVPEQGRDAFLDKAYQKHFSGRSYLQARHFLYLTMSSRSRALHSMERSSLLRGTALGKLPTPEHIGEFSSRCQEFIAVVTSCAGVTARRLTDSDLLGQEGGDGGLIEQVMMLDTGNVSDVVFRPDSVRINDSSTVVFTIGENEQIPSSLSTVRRMDQYSSAGSEVNLCMASPIGLSLASCPHICNTYIIKPCQQDILSELDKKSLRMRQFSTDGANALSAKENHEFIEGYHQEGLTGVYTHSNIICWTSGQSERQFRQLRADVSAALSSMGVVAVRDIYSAPILWSAAIPGCAVELSSDHLILTELKTALAFMQYETFESGLKEGAIRLTDRFRHIPLVLDMQRHAAAANWINNYNIFLSGASGTGKSFTTSSILYNMWSAGEHVFIIDIGGSYEQVCAVVHDESGGVDGIYNRWDRSKPLSFCPLAFWRQWVDEKGILQRDDPSLNFFISLLTTLGTDKEKGVLFGDFEETVISYFIQQFLSYWKDTERELPLFDDFVLWLRDFLIYGDDTPDGQKGQMRSFLTPSGVMIDRTVFDGGRFIEALSSYSRQGQFGFLLNSDKPQDLFTSRFTVFDVGELSEVSNSKFYSICVLCIVNAFDVKMRSKDLPGFKVMAIDEAWKAISNETMAPYLRELWKTARKMSTTAMVITQELDDILSSDVIRETILQNSDIKILMSQEGNKNNFSKISGPLGLSQMDVNLIFSMAGTESRSKDVFIKWGGSRSGVYTVEACPEQLWAFESNHSRKKPLYDRMKECGSMIKAIEQMSNEGKLP